MNDIAELNDRFRRTGLGGQLTLTRGIASLPFDDQQAILRRVRAFDAFTEDNDPHGEHDFGAFDFDGAGRIFWKIDYYDSSLNWHSDDPADPATTVRVLTIMLAAEY